MSCLVLIIGLILMFSYCGCKTGGEAALFWLGMILVLYHVEIEKKFEKE